MNIVLSFQDSDLGEGEGGEGGEGGERWRVCLQLEPARGEWVELGWLPWRANNFPDPPPDLCQAVSREEG